MHLNSTAARPVKSLLCAALLASSMTLGAGVAQAAAPVYTTMDRSTEALIDKATAQAVWKEQLTAKVTPRLHKLYPTGKWGFLAQVEGGFTESKICVVTARAALVPRRTMGGLTFKPEKMATTFDAIPGATNEQCKALAKAKMTEAVKSVIDSLAAAK